MGETGSAGRRHTRPDERMSFWEHTYGKRPPTSATGTRIVGAGPGPTSGVLSRLLGFLASSGLSIAAFLTQVARDRPLTAS